nr:immunoglobulin heavy chain junction region [Macaca mulatta]MOW18849.1 immunoglobulin heavy chain junction region [Macaca mulatta]MOW18944.1 immunoglobulin heavy chain junction region [Macaca mulatta]MOW19010.1 immunoglobulin heavy chain junction region [Macaca mulatta]MOW19063.1 immunoglobulin heavy chain junction region [Macaca mulatta]
CARDGSGRVSIAAGPGRFDVW